MDNLFGIHSKDFSNGKPTEPHYHPEPPRWHGLNRYINKYLPQIKGLVWLQRDNTFEKSLHKFVCRHTDWSTKDLTDERRNTMKHNVHYEKQL